MAKFARIINNMVKQVILIDDNDCLDSNGDESEEVGAAFCRKLFGEDTDTVWLQTSFNTHHGVHSTVGKTALRGNFASCGMSYDPEGDVFVRIKPYPSWIYNSVTSDWDPPVAYPDDGKDYAWNENTKAWDRILPYDPDD